jgi:hypothetical protein
MTLAWHLLSVCRLSACGPISLLLLLVPMWAWSDVPPPRPAPSPEEMQELARQLGDEHFTVREKASSRLLEIGSAALPLIEKTSGDSDPEVRQRAWQIIDQWAADGDIGALLFQLSSPCAPIRAGAAESLGKLEAKAQPALPGLIKAVEDGQEIVRCSAQEALKKVQATLPLRLEVKHTVDAIDLDSPTVFQIDVSNQGKTAATQACITVLVPEQLAITGVDGPLKHSIEGNRIVCEPVTLGAGDTRSCQINVKAKAVGSVRLQVELTADGLLAPIVGEATTTISPPAPVQGQPGK